MNRRGFLKALGKGAIALAASPAVDLIVPQTCNALAMQSELTSVELSILAEAYSKFFAEVGALIPILALTAPEKHP